eukprot:GHVU01151700.1.p1 GENE.GHVU01151700.1~~GHVU01151700.1.p1  ORF type:complete len:148 (-),score=3.74 GHVU01151700.1:265-708(-)
MHAHARMHARASIHIFSTTQILSSICFHLSTLHTNCTIDSKFNQPQGHRSVVACFWMSTVGRCWARGGTWSQTRLLARAQPQYIQEVRRKRTGEFPIRSSKGESSKPPRCPFTVAAVPGSRTAMHRHRGTNAGRCDNTNRNKIIIVF